METVQHASFLRAVTQAEQDPARLAFISDHIANCLLLDASFLHLHLSQLHTSELCDQMPDFVLNTNKHLKVFN